MISTQGLKFGLSVGQRHLDLPEKSEITTNYCMWNNLSDYSQDNQNNHREVGCETDLFVGSELLYEQVNFCFYLSNVQVDFQTLLY